MLPLLQNHATETILCAPTATISFDCFSEPFHARSTWIFPVALGFPLAKVTFCSRDSVNRTLFLFWTGTVTPSDGNLTIYSEHSSFASLTFPKSPTFRFYSASLLWVAWNEAPEFLTQESSLPSTESLCIKPRRILRSRIQIFMTSTLKDVWTSMQPTSQLCPAPIVTVIPTHAKRHSMSRTFTRTISARPSPSINTKIHSKMSNSWSPPNKEYHPQFQTS